MTTNFNYMLFIPKDKETVIYLIIQFCFISLLLFHKIKNNNKNAIATLIISNIFAIAYIYPNYKLITESSFSAILSVYVFVRIINMTVIIRSSYKKYPKSIFISSIILLILDIAFMTIQFTKK